MLAFQMAGILWVVLPSLLFLILPAFTTLIRRKETDDNVYDIRCRGTLPWYYWPRPFSRARYNTLHDLCSYDRPFSAGCQCNGVGQVECVPQYANRIIFASSMRVYCEIWCECVFKDIYMHLPPIRVTPVTSWSSESVLDEADQPQTQQDLETSKPVDFLKPLKHSCAGTCSGSTSHCRHSRSNCRCVAERKSAVEPLIFVASCKEFDLGKRDGDLEYNCPCNMSYVSAACCHSENGLIWEGPEMQLGILA